MQAATSLYFLRHAEVEAKYQGVFGGRIDMNLSPRGTEQAEKLAAYLGLKKFDALYASPMIRVQQTLKPILNEMKIVPVIMPGLREVDFGDWTGCNWAQITERFGVRAFDWLSQIENGTMPNAETAVTFRARVEPCMESILTAHPGQTIAVACHGGVIRMALAILLNLKFSQTAAFEIDYASLTHVLCSPEKNELQLLNLTPWRDLP